MNALMDGDQTWYAWVAGDPLETMKFCVDTIPDVDAGSLFHYPEHYLIGHSMIYAESPEGASALLCDTEFLCSCEATGLCPNVGHNLMFVMLHL